ncbi:sugar-binding protein [Salmonella bongori serovar 40:z35:-]|uniref:sugar-binding protein n=1 Tax=Salmonella bongori TaxID=54736 RepID=UPI0017C357B9|nr:sugar-binding protein [Salmonella bongori]EGE4653090.1 sugar-binding protein [Salmonella bongori serovar 40:z35:- str. 95-0123]QVP36752.1 sugar-binding protein [Salmonella bongori serovar 40:z35:-]
MTDITNIIVDGSFEDGLTEQWQIGSLVEVEASDSNHFCRIDSANALSQRITLETFMTYALAFSIKGSIAGKLFVKSADGATTFFEHEINMTPGDDWYTESLEFSTQASAGDAIVTFMAPGDVGAGALFIDNIEMVAVPFVFTRPLWVNLDQTLNGYAYYQYGIKTTVDAAEQTYRLYKNGSYITEFTVGPDDFAQSTSLSALAASDVFKLTIVNAKTTAEHMLSEETMENLLAKGVIYLTE